jgi:hypothetical protein
MYVVQVFNVKIYINFCINSKFVGKSVEHHILKLSFSLLRLNYFDRILSLAKN